MMNSGSRCLYGDKIISFLEADNNAILGILCSRYHGNALTTTREAWEQEIVILKRALQAFDMYPQYWTPSIGGTYQRSKGVF